jgi:hypothetical protein
MAYILLNSKASTPRNSAKTQPCLSGCQTTLGDSNPISSLATSLGTTPGTLLLLAGGGLVLGYMVNNLFTGVGRKVRKTRSAWRKKRELKRRTHTAPGTGFMWQMALLLALTGGAVWYFATRNSGGKA